MTEMQGEMMIYRIHYTLSDGTEDSFVVSGTVLEDIQKEAESGVRIRGGQNPWSVRI